MSLLVKIYCTTNFILNAFYQVTWTPEYAKQVQGHGKASNVYFCKQMPPWNGALLVMEELCLKSWI